MKPAPKVGDWVRTDNTSEHRVAKRHGGFLDLDCGQVLHTALLLAVMPAPTVKACPVCRETAEQ